MSISAPSPVSFVCKDCGATFLRPRQLRGHTIGKHVRRVRAQNASIRVDSLSPYQIGYVAAFLDGEGGIQITRTERKDRAYKIALHPMVYFTNTWREAIDAIRDCIGAGSKVTARSRDGQKDTYLLHVTGMRNIQLLSRVLLPYLIIKLERARVMLEFCESRLRHSRGGDRRYNEEELGLYTTLFRLNERGVSKHANARIAN